MSQLERNPMNFQQIKKSGQLTIPKEIRDEVNLKDGDLIDVKLCPTSGHILIELLEVKPKTLKEPSISKSNIGFAVDYETYDENHID